MKRAIEKTPDRVKILGLGHPRTGTGYTTSLLNKWGLDIGHEVFKSDGIVAWQFVEDYSPWTYMSWMIGKVPEYDILIYNVRNPKDSIPSIVFTEGKTLNWRINRLNIERSYNPVEQAILSILKFDELILAKSPDIIYRIEDQELRLFEKLVNEQGLKLNWVAPENKKVNARVHDSIDTLTTDINTVRAELKKSLNMYCRTYGYEEFFK